MDFNPPSPCGEGRRRPCAETLYSRFQSTLPVWGGTNAEKTQEQLIIISIHPPRVGRDRTTLTVETYQLRFQSTLPVWGGTMIDLAKLQKIEFQSTLPVWGGTVINSLRKSWNKLFQSTLPVWGGTATRRPCRADSWISIHPPRVGRDGRCWPASPTDTNFNPPSPCGEGLSPCVTPPISPWYFNPPSPCGEGLVSGPQIAGGWHDFNPPSPCGEGRIGVGPELI